MVVVLRGSYGAAIDWETWSIPRRGDSAFMQGLRPVFTSMQLLLRPRVGDGASFSFWEAGWCWSRALSGLTSATIRPSTRPRGHSAVSLGHRLVPFPAQHPLGPAICRPICFAYNSHPNLADGEGSRRQGVERWLFLCPHHLPSLSRL